MLGLSRPPVWGVVALVTVVLANVALFAFLALRPTASYADEAAQSRSQASVDIAPPTTTEPAPVTPVPQAPAPQPVLAVYGDGYSTGSSLGGLSEAGWPARVAAAVDARLELHAVSMAGYAATGTTGQTFVDLVSDAAVPEAAVTVVFGSRNDLGQSAEAVGANADAALDAIRTGSPDSSIVVVGPAWSSGDVPDELYGLRDAVEGAATRAGARFVDPLGDGWFSGSAGLIADDGISPTDTGHQHMAERLTPVITQELTAD